MWLQVYWPGMLLSAGLALPRRVFGHGFLTSRGLKMGKSMGNVVDPQVRREIAERAICCGFVDESSLCHHRQRLWGSPMCRDPPRIATGVGEGPTMQTRCSTTWRQQVMPHSFQIELSLS